VLADFVAHFLDYTLVDLLGSLYGLLCRYRFGSGARFGVVNIIDRLAQPIFQFISIPFEQLSTSAKSTAKANSAKLGLRAFDSINSFIVRALFADNIGQF
jgi:hypothetical protein